jgi:hypothetical protein
VSPNNLLSKPAARSRQLLTFAEADRAIYIDFEALATKPPHPALIGVLIGAEGEALEQIIADERLWPARVAGHRPLRALGLEETVETIVRKAENDDAPIIGWSFFDRDRLIDARPDLAGEIKARYVNALHIARPWRRAIYPSFPIEPEDDYSPKHTLDQYAVLARYRNATALRGATPAEWIRHTLKQLETHGGRYGRTTKQTKRDWHKLLEYNRHDCLALRHIVLKATHELASWRAYERTRFCVRDGKRAVCFMAGSASPRLDALLERHRQRDWAFVTAWNPASQQLTREENDQRQAILRREMESLGFAILPGEGIGEDPSWTAEESLLVMGISEGKAVALGRRHGQLAIVCGRKGAPSRLVSCAEVPRALAQ